jgi:23S rRNA (cytosine1962-C5)-methyltransferase
LNSLVLRCVIYEDEHLLAVNKPAGFNTHAPSPFAGEGIYDWLRHREPRWSDLAIIHRLDKETSGVLLFSKSKVANRSLTEQFTNRQVKKRYLFVTSHRPQQEAFVAKSNVVRIGEKYASKPWASDGNNAETRFRVLGSIESTRFFSGAADVDLLDGWRHKISNEIEHRGSPLFVIEAEPLTGRTHQIRVHAASEGVPILGDVIYGGVKAARVYLHSVELAVQHPATGKGLLLNAQTSSARNGFELREAVIDSEPTNAYRLIHGAGDSRAGWNVDRLGDYVLSQSQDALDKDELDELKRIVKLTPARGALHKILRRDVRRTTPAEASPQLALGSAPPERFTIRENGVQFELSLNEGYSPGLFLDQRENRRRLLSGWIAAEFPVPPGRKPENLAERIHSKTKPPCELLNLFSYTCAFSVCGALLGARTTSVDLSKKYLEWGKRNFELNRISVADHDFIFGDSLDWLRRFAKKDRRFEIILIDPPTFSQSKEHGAFRVEKDLSRLVQAALVLLKPNGTLFVSTNSADWPPEAFLDSIDSALAAEKRKCVRRHYAPQPPDFPISKAEPAYLKSVWLCVS